jgi:hypothetical protein
MLRLFIFVVAAIAALPAQAATYTFDFRNPGAPDTTIGSTARFESGSPAFGVDVYSMQQFGSVFYSARKIVQGSGGLGVTTKWDSAHNGAAGQLDGAGTKAEGLYFDFDHAVRVTEIVFGGVGKNDNASIFADLTNDGTNLFITQEANLYLPANNPYTAMFGSIIDRLLLGAPKWNDDYYVASITVTKMPVPAAGVLFASALGLAGWARRRKAKVAS